MTFIVVGGGPTGVELAGALAELTRDALRGEFRNVDPRSAHVTLVEMEDRLLTAYPPVLSGAARQQLTALGVTVRTGTAVSEITASQVTVRTGQISERIDARTVLWAAGTRPTTFGRRVAAELGAPVDATGRIVVEPDLSVPHHPEVLVIGDLAAARRADGSSVPAVAQGGIQGGRHVGRVVEARLRGMPAPAFRYRDKGELAMIGRFRTVARFPHVRMAGPLAWLVWLGVHLFYLQGVQNRLLVGMRWLWTALSGARATRLITGAPGAVGALPPVGLLADGAAPAVPLPRPVGIAPRSRSAGRLAARTFGHARDPRRRPVTSRRLGGSHW